MKYINELSCTIDLPSTRVRAESLFRKFQRTIEETDRKNSSSAGPSTLRFRLGNAPTSPAAGGASSSNAKGKQIEVQAPEISEDLRKLLSREVVRAEGV